MWQLLAGALAVGGGLYLATQANSKATSTAVQGIGNAAAIQQATDAQIAANGGAGPGAAYLRTLVASPNTLTAAQQTQLADLRRSTAGQLHGSSFAGNGRTAATVFDKTEDQFTNSALQQNRQAATNAAGTLEGISTNAAMAGSKAGADAAENIARIQASGGIADANLLAGGLGRVGSMITGGGMGGGGGGGGGGTGQAMGDVGSYLSRQSKLQMLDWPTV